jgi:hypothetical protein
MKEGACMFVLGEQMETDMVTFLPGHVSRKADWWLVLT